MPGAPRFTYRPVASGDVAAIHALHSDPATNLHNPFGASPDEAASAAMLDDWVSHWREHGFGYELAFDGEQVAGITGARLDVWHEASVLNLYWRLLPAYQGRGLALPLGEHALRGARAAASGRLIVARMMPANAGSIRVAEKLGLVRRPDLDGDAFGAAWIVFADDRGLR